MCHWGQALTFEKPTPVPVSSLCPLLADEDAGLSSSSSAMPVYSAAFMFPNHGHEQSTIVNLKLNIL